MALGPATEGDIPTNELSTCGHRRLFSSDFPIPRSTAGACNFIGFLATAHKLRVPFLLIKWQPQRQLLGRGGTSQVNQAQVNLETSFAFKRISDSEKLNKPEQEIFRCLINEITILQCLATQKHTNILELQGIGWDIPSNSGNPSDHGEVWPVLIFEKSHFGDLYNFAKSPAGRNLSIGERLRICVQVGNALAYMQSNSIVHGDIKPHNVFVFDDESGFFTAKVADFGYSNRFSRDSSNISLPESWPWYAPECRMYPQLSLAQAATADVFSFGMLCLWFLFEKYFSGILPLPATAQSWRAPSSYKDGSRALHYLAQLKETDCLEKFASQLVLAEPTIGSEQRQMLQKLFRGCLVSDPSRRDADIQKALGHLDSTLYIIPLALDDMAPAGEDDFQLYHSMYLFYLCDYRVRSHIVKQLERIVAGRPTSPLATQLAFSYELGFGQTNDENETRSFDYDREEIRNLLRFELAGWMPISRNAGLYEYLLSAGHTQSVNAADSYKEDRVLKTAESVIRNEVQRAENILGGENDVPLCLKLLLCDVLNLQKRWEESEALQISIFKARHTDEGQESPIASFAANRLASTYRDQGRLKEAEMLYLEISNAGERRIEGLLRTLTNQLNLASVYLRQERWDDVEKLCVRVAEAHELLGKENATILAGMAYLVVAYWHQNRLREAKELGVEVLELGQKISDRVHPDPLLEMPDIVSAEIPDGEIANSKDENGRTPLSQAAYNGEHASVQLWIDRGADIEARDKYDNTPLSLAAQEGHESITELLLEQGANIESQDSYLGQTPLLWAVDRNRESMVKLLLDRGADPRQKNHQGDTPLLLSIEHRNEAVAHLLLNQGVDIESRNNRGHTALFNAVFWGQETVLRSLLDHGADIESKDVTESSPLSIAAMRKFEAITQLLLQRGAAIESKDNRGMTALSWAAYGGDENVVRLLLDGGADIETKDKYGRTPLSIATRHGHQGVEQLLLGRSIDARAATTV